MYCNQCGAENAADAIYCKNCGRRLDGKLICPSCGKEVAGDSAFCSYCGKKIAGSTPNTAQAGAVAAANANPVNYKKILKITAAFAVLATAIISLIFVFCMGVTQTAAAMGYGSVSEDTFLYYFFGKGYSEIGELTEDMTEFSVYFSMTLYTPIVLGTIISAVTIVVVLIFSILGIVFSIYNLTGKSENNGAVYALSAFFAYVVGASLLLALSNSKINSEYEFLACSFNAPTVAGIVLGAVSIAVYAGCSVAGQGKKLLNTDVIVKLITSVIMIALTGAVMGILPSPTYGMKFGGVNLGGMISTGIMTIIIAMGAMGVTEKELYFIDNADAVYSLELIAFIMLAALLTLAACLLVRAISSTANEKRKFMPLDYSISMLILSVLFIVFTAVGGEQFVKAAEYAGGATVAGEIVENFSLTFAVPIVVLVLSVLSLGISITRLVLIKKFAREENI